MVEENMTEPIQSEHCVDDAYLDYPAVERITYMDVAARGLLSYKVRATIDSHVGMRTFHSINKDEYFDLVERTRIRFAQLINANPDEIALTKNVSEGLNIIVASLPWQGGDNIILCPELEHPNSVYSCLNLRRRGVEVRTVHSRDGYLPVEEMVHSIDDRTRVVTVSSVTFAPGFRTAIDVLGHACRTHGVFFLVDAAQSCGIINTDVVASKIDGLAVSTQKGLLALYGMGFLYCRRDWAEQMHPVYLARFGVDMGNAHEATMGSDNYDLMAAARRFDLGNYNFLGCAAVETSIIQLLGYNIDEIERYVIGLANQLANGFVELGLPVCGGNPGPHLAHIVTLGKLDFGKHGATEDERWNKLYKYLFDHSVKLSVRSGVLRFSLHVYNTSKDVERVLDLTQRWLRD